MQFIIKRVPNHKQRYITSPYYKKLPDYLYRAIYCKINFKYI